MGVSDRLRRTLATWAVGGAHVLLVEAPGWWQVRAAVEQAMAGRGWRQALSPADADVLCVAGAPGERLTAAVDRVWEQLPGPRARVEIREVSAVDDALAAAAAVLLDDARQRRDARGRAQVLGRDASDEDMAPAGIPLAGNSEDDRDGLEMDVLTVPLGPVLAYWPAGLVLTCTLSGDVVTAAEVEVLPAADPPPAALPRVPGGEQRLARRCDHAATLLALAGWDDAAARARRVRDALLTGRDARDAQGSRLDRLHRMVARSATLRWQLRGLGRLDDAALARLRLPGGAGGDVHDRLLAMLDPGVETELGAEHGHDPGAGPALHRTDVLPDLVTGLDLAAARLVVASLGVQTTGPTVPVEPEASRA